MEGTSLKVLELIEKLPEKERDKFTLEYNARRKSETTALVLTAIGCLGIGGLQRFYIGDVGLGILYILTGGIIYIGTLYDLIKIKELVDEANYKIAQQILQEMKILGKSKKGNNESKDSSNK